MEDRRRDIEEMARDRALSEVTSEWLGLSAKHKYSYNFTWLGRPIIQYPQDMVAMQEIVWFVRPDLIIETGIAHGGSLIFYASLLELIGNGEILGVDIDIRQHNRLEIERHAMFKRITMIEGSSISEGTLEQVRDFSRGKERVMVCLDSCHTHEHVKMELDEYSSLVTKGSYLVVFDTVIENLPDELNQDRPWGKGNNPMTAVAAFLESNKDFVVDEEIQRKLLITVAPGGYLKRIRD